MSNKWKCAGLILDRGMTDVRWSIGTREWWLSCSLPRACFTVHLERAGIPVCSTSSYPRLLWKAALQRHPLGFYIGSSKSLGITGEKLTRELGFHYIPCHLTPSILHKWKASSVLQHYLTSQRWNIYGARLFGRSPLVRSIYKGARATDMSGQGKRYFNACRHGHHLSLKCTRIQSITCQLMLWFELRRHIQ